jgi:outer membrane lipoprotein-sorting protein
MTPIAPSAPQSETAIAPNRAVQVEAEAVLSAWEAKVKSLSSFTCRFRQEKKVSFMRRPLVSTGRMAFKERRLLWVTETPAESFLSVGTEEVRIYTPEFETLEIYPLAAGGGEGGAATLGGFPGFTGDFSKLKELYAVELVADPAPAAEGDSRLRFTPRGDDTKKDVTAIEVVLDREQIVKAWRLLRANGDELALTLSDFVANAKVRDEDLEFAVPEGTKVVRPLAAGARQ